MFSLPLIGGIAFSAGLFWWYRWDLAARRKRGPPPYPSNETPFSGSSSIIDGILGKLRVIGATNISSNLDQQSHSSADIEGDMRILNAYTWGAYKDLPPPMKQVIEHVVLMRLLLNAYSMYLHDHAEVRALLLEGWETGTFEALRDHSLFLSLRNYATGLFNNQNDDGPVRVGSANWNWMSQGTTEVSIYGGKFVDTSGGDMYNVAGDLWRIICSTDDNRKTAEWFFDIDYRAIHNEIVRKRSKSTGGWFLRSHEYGRWYNSRHGVRILWCPGIPGVGKTIMTSLVVDHLRTLDESQRFVGIIYFSYELRSQQSRLAILEALCRQVFEIREDFAFEDLYRLHEPCKSRPVEAELRATLSNAFQHYQTCYVVLDALDEFTQQYSDKQVRDMIKDLLSLGANVKLLITTRILGDMETTFRDLGASKEPIITHDADMRVYLMERVASLKSKVDFEISDNFSKEMIDKVVQAAKGRFLVAELDMNLLDDQLSLGALEDVLENLTNGIDDTYTRVLELIQRYSNDRRELAMKALMWVAYAQRRLSVRELQYALATRQDKNRISNFVVPLSTITSLCAGLLVVEGRGRRYESDGERIVRFVHFTTQEFFRNVQVKYFLDAHKEMFVTCMEHLSFMCPLTPLKRSTPPGLHRPCSPEVTPPFYDYAALNWGYHANTHHESLSTEVVGFLLRNNQSVELACRYILKQSGDGLTGAHGFVIFLATYHDQACALPVLLNHVQTIPRTEKQRTAMHIATMLGRQNAIQAMLEWPGSSPEDDKHPDNNLPQPSTTTPSYEVHHVILANLRDAYGRTPLIYAAQYGRESITSLLLMHRGIDLNAKDNDDRTALCHAVQRNEESIVKLFLEHEGVDASSKDKNGRTAFWHAVLMGNESVIKLLLHHGGFDVDLKDKDGQTAFLYAVQSSEESVIKLLLEHGAVDPDLGDNNHRTPLWYAVHWGRKSVIELLLSRGGIKVNSKDNNGQTPLSYAAQRGQEPVVRLLLDHSDVDVNSTDNNGQTPFSYAAQKGDESIIKLFLEHGGVEMDIRDNKGRTAFSYASQVGEETLVKLLLCHKGVEVNSKDVDGRTPFSYAVQRGEESITQLFLDHEGVEVGSKDNNGRTPFSYAAQIGKDSIIKLFLRHTDVEVESKDNNGRTPFSYAAETGDESTVKLLLVHGGIDLDSKDNGGRTPFSYAARTGCYSIIKLLLDHGGVEVNSKDNYDRTPFWYAVREVRESIVKLLVEYGGVEVDRRDSDGRTPLSLAARRGDSIIIELLLKHGADVNSRDNNGRTPVGHASQNGWQSIAKLLLDHGGMIPVPAD